MYSIMDLLQKIPTRYCIAFMIYINASYYMIVRAIISINLVAMVPVNANITNESDTALNWTAYERGIVLSSYYWGCLTGNFIAGPVLEAVSIRMALTACTFANGVLTILGPLAAKQGVEFMILSRLIIGLLSVDQLNFPESLHLCTSLVYCSSIFLIRILWGLHFLHTSAPNYIANTLGYSIISTGLMSAFVYLFKSLVAFGSGIMSDVLLKKDMISLKVMQYGGIFLSHILPGCGLLFMLKMGFPMMSYVIIIRISMALNGLTTLSCTVNTHFYLTANYVSTVSGLTYGAMTIASIITPIVTAHLTKEDEDAQDTLHWSSYERALVLAAHSWGYVCGNLLGGFIGERFSPKLVILVALCGGGVLTMLSPAAAYQGYVALTVIRIAMGLFAGFCFPCAHFLIANWAVPDEKGMFVGALIGGTLGTFFAWTLCGFIIEIFGWQWGFYAFNFILPPIAILWWYLVADSPSKHRSISPKEKEYLENEIEINTSNKPKPPIGRFLTSVPVLSLLILNYCNGWGIYFVTTAIPSYMANALGYDIRSSGYLSALTYLMRSSAAFIAGSIGDVFLRRKLITLNVLRKVGVVFSHILPGFCLFLMTYPNFSRSTYVMLIIMTMGLNGFVSVTSAVNNHDLTKNFAGTLSGFTCSVVASAGLIAPLVTAHLIKEDETSLYLWRSVLCLAGGLYIFSGLQFILFGSTKVQSWDKINTKY